MSAIEFCNISKRFGDRLVVDNVSFQVEPGEALCLFGPSGCGKTTLLRIAAGLEQPDSGEVHFNGQVMTGNGSSFVPPHARNAGMVFQDFALWPHMTVHKHLDFVLRPKGMTSLNRKERIGEMLELCQLTEYATSFPCDLSGGEKQRLGIARALVTNPQILLLDEPFSNLDMDLQDRIVQHLLNIRNNEGKSIIIATHDIGESERLADKKYEFQVPERAASQSTIPKEVKYYE